MLATFNKLGEKITKVFGEPTALGMNLHAFSGDPLSSLLPWQAYDEESRIFIGKNSLGFTLEAIPLVGATHAATKEIASIFQDVLEEGDSLQCLLWADHRTAPFLEKWEKAREHAEEIYREIAHKRAQFYQNSPSINPRIFRFMLSFSTQAKCDAVTIEKLKEKKEKILKTLKNLTYAYVWDIDDFLHTTGSLINFTQERDVKKRHWNPFQTLASQLPTGGLLSIEENYLKWGKEKGTCIKTFRAVDRPSFWSLAEMQRLIGDVYRDAFRIHVPFYLHYGVHCPKQSKEEGKFKRRSHLIEKQGRSSLLMRLIPALAEELQESDAIRKELVQSSKFVWTQLSAGVWAEKEHLPAAEQSLKVFFALTSSPLRRIITYIFHPIFLHCP